MIKNTILIVDYCGADDIAFIVVDGDKSYLYGVYLGGCDVDELYEEELEDILDNEKKYSNFPADKFYPGETAVAVVGVLN